MKKRFLVISLHNDAQCRLGLMICGILFMCGCVAGTVTAGLVNDGTRLNEFFSSFMSFFLTGNASRQNLMSAVLDAFKYCLVAVALGFSIVGVFLIPLLSAVRGFFLCFSVAMVVRVLGENGVALALAIFGIGTMITIPCFFILSVDAFYASAYIFRLTTQRTQKFTAVPFNSRYFIRCGICLLVLMLSALIDVYMTPYLISLAAARI